MNGDSESLVDFSRAGCLMLSFCLQHGNAEKMNGRERRHSSQLTSFGDVDKIFTTGRGTTGRFGLSELPGGDQAQR